LTGDEAHLVGPVLRVFVPQQLRGIFPRIALLERLVVTAEQGNVVEGDLPLTQEVAAIVFAARHVDGVARFALVERLPRIGEGLVEGTVAAALSCTHEPIACVDRGGYKESKGEQE